MYTAALPAACSGGTYSHNHSTQTYTAHRMYTAAPQQSAAAGHTVTITVHTLHTGCTPRPPSSLQRRDIQSQSQYTDIHCTQDVHRGLPAVCSGGTYRHNHSTHTYTAHRMYTAPPPPSSLQRWDIQSQSQYTVHTLHTGCTPRPPPPAVCSGGTYRHNHSTYTAHRMYTAAPQQSAAAGHTVTITVHRHTLHTGCTPRPFQQPAAAGHTVTITVHTLHTGCTPRPPSSLQRRDIQSQSQYIDMHCTQDVHRGLPAACSGGTYSHNHSTYTAHRMYTAALPAACSGGTYRHNHSTYTAHRMYTAAPQQPAAAGHTVTITVHRHTLHTGCTPRPPSSLQRRDIQSQSQYTDIHCTQDVHRGPPAVCSGGTYSHNHSTQTYTAHRMYTAALQQSAAAGHTVTITVHRHALHTGCTPRPSSSLQQRDIQSQSQYTYIHCTQDVHRGPPSSLQRRDIQSQSQYTDINCTQDVHRGPPSSLQRRDIPSQSQYTDIHCTQDVHRGPPSSLQRRDIPSQSQYIHCTHDVHRGPPAACSGGTYRHNHSTYTAHRMYTASPQQSAAAGHTVTITVHTLHTGCTPRPPSSLQRRDIQSQSQYTDIHCTQDVHRGPPSSLQRRDIPSQSQYTDIHCTQDGRPSQHSGGTYRHNHSTQTYTAQYTAGPSSLQRRDIQSQSQYTYIHCTQDVHRGPPAVHTITVHTLHTGCTPRPPSSLQRRDIQSQSQYTDIHCTQDVHRGLPAACSGGTYRHNHSTQTYTAHRMYTAAPQQPAAAGHTVTITVHTVHTLHTGCTPRPSQQSAAAGHTVTITVHTLHTGCTPRPPSSLQRRDIQSQSQYTDIHRTQDVHRGPHGSLEGVGGLKTNEAYHSKADALLIPEMYYFFFGKFTYALFRNVCFIKFGTFSAMLALPVMIREEYGQMAHQTFPNILLSNAWLRSRASLGLSMTTHLTRAR